MEPIFGLRHDMYNKTTSRNATYSTHYSQYRLVFWVVLTASYLHLDSIAYASEYPYTYRSSYLLGRGDTGIADADNEDAIFYNPGALAFGTGIYKKTVLPSLGLEFSSSISDMVTKIGLQDEETTDALREAIGVPQHVGLNLFSGVVFRRAALGAYATSRNTALIAKDPLEGATEKASLESSSTYGMTLSAAHDISDSQGVGLTTRIITKSQASVEFVATDADSLSGNDELVMTGSGFAFDFGYLYKYKGATNMNLGVTVQNIGTTAFEPSTKSSLPKEDRPLKDDPQTVNVGFMVEKVARLSSFKFLTDIRDLLNNTDSTIYKRLHMGSEISIDGYLGITVGLNQGYPTFGTYFDIRLLRIDAGVYTEEIGDTVGERGDKRYFLRLLTGF